MKGVLVSNNAEFAKNVTHYFLKNAHRAPFGWNKHELGAEKVTNSTF